MNNQPKGRWLFVPEGWTAVPTWNNWAMRKAMRDATPEDYAGDILDHALLKALEAAPKPPKLFLIKD